MTTPETTTPPSLPPDVLPAGGRRRAPRPPRTWLRPAAIAAAVAMAAGGVGWALTRDVHHAAVRPAAADGLHAADTGRPVLTPAVAASVVRRYWPAHEAALVKHDLRALARMSGGPAREWEQAVVACGCLTLSKPRPMLAVNYFVPRQTRYPATFVATVDTASGVDGYRTEVLVFTKAAAHAAWLVTEDSYYAPRTGAVVHIDGPSSGAGGFDQPVSAAQHQRALTLAADLAGLWETTKETSDVPAVTDFDVSGQTQDRLGTLAAYPQDGVQANGLLGHYTFYALPTDRLVEVGVAGGYDLACQPLRESVDYRAQEGQLIRQDPARHNWGPTVAPGYYHEVLSKDVWQTCFLVPPSGGAVVVLNQDIGGSVVHVAT